MKIRYGLVLAMAIGLGLAGCASGASSGGGGSTAAAPSGGAGENPRNTDLTSAAQMALDAANEATDAAEARTWYELALGHAESAITEDGRNPLAHRLAAMASMGTDDYVSADAHFDHAVALRPLYEFDFVGIRERAWIDLYQAASPLVAAADYEEAIVYFENAHAIYDQRPEAMITLGQLYSQLREHDKAIASLDAAMAFMESDAIAEADSATIEGWREQSADLPMLRAQVLSDAGRFEESVAAYRELSAANPTDTEIKRGLGSILMQMGNKAEALEVYSDLMSTPGLSAADLFSIGVGFYQASDYGNASQAFSNAADVSVKDRDAIEMWARSLQLDSAFASVPDVAARWVELDPNSQNAYLILAQAANQLDDQAATQAAIQAVDGLEVTMNDLQMQRFAAGGATVSGSVINKKLAEGASVSVVFTFYSDDGSPMGTVTESVSAGAADMASVFRVDFDSVETVGGYSYELSAN
jgi:tetratricopeptide (TPR) repeat protein